MASRPPQRDFLLATPDEIRAGKTSDIYFFRTLDVLKRARKDRTRVVAEATAQKLPEGWPWAVYVGLREVLPLLEGRQVDLWSLPEGTIFSPKTSNGIPVPVLVLEGPYREFCIYETPMLGFLCQPTGIATRAARLRKAAGDRPLLSFGVRRMHPGIAPLIERCVYIGGLDAVTTPLGGELLGKEPVGTMPHSLTIVMGGPKAAFRALSKHLPKKIPRVALVDTYYDEKAETLIAALEIKDLAGVRLDTPESRRGNFAHIVHEIRWELDLRGHKDAKIYASGGLNEAAIPALIKAGVDAFGVGTSLSNAPTVDFALDIVEREGEPVAKRGKFGGRKNVTRCARCGALEVGRGACPGCGGRMKAALVRYLRQGKRVGDLPGEDEVRAFVLEQLAYREN